MEFEKKDLLNMGEIRLLITSDFPNEQAKIITSKLINYCFIHSDRNIYALQPNITYSKTDHIDDKLITYTTSLIEQSYKNLTDDEKERITDKFPKEYKKIFQNVSVSKYMPQLKTDLLKSNIVFDTYLDVIHFNNGYYDLTTKQFNKRVKHLHYITHYIQHDYIPSTLPQKIVLRKIIEKIYPLEADRNCVLREIGWTLSGRSSRDQSTLFLLGDGSSGKSFILSLTGLAIGCYMLELKSDTFCVGNPKLDKILNEYSTSPHIRLSWVNEMTDKKIAEDIFKDFCEGKLRTTKLFQDGLFNFKHYSKCIVTANQMPGIKIDTGVTRKFLGYTHKSHFTDIEAMVDHKKHIYLKDKLMLEKLVQQNLMCAWFDILAEYCFEAYKNPTNVYTENFSETKKTVIDANDFILDFIDGYLTKTDDPTHRIGKNQMCKLFATVYPNKHLSPLQLMTSLKEKKIDYNCKLRCDNIQGCYVGVKLTDDIDEDEEVLNVGVDKTDQSVKYALQTDYDELKKQLRELQLEKLLRMDTIRLELIEARKNVYDKLLKIPETKSTVIEVVLSFKELDDIFGM